LAGVVWWVRRRAAAYWARAARWSARVAVRGTNSGLALARVRRGMGNLQEADHG
jgi:hypothetical protein